MNEREFKTNMTGAKAFQGLSDSPDSEFWAGYQRGLRRLQHGANFGTDKEHSLWLSLIDEQRDTTRRYRGEGYAAGFSGAAISDAVEIMKKITLDPDKLTAAGQALYGDRWQSDLAKALGVDSRRVRHWLSGDRPTPGGVWEDVEKILEQKKSDIDNVLDILPKPPIS